MTVIEGVDYSDSVPSAHALLAAGKQFVVRYGGPGTSDKWLTASELASLQDAGISVVANAEGAAGGFRTFATGASWAQRADAWFQNLGMPADRPIYFSVDWDANSGDWQAIDSACDGAASIIGRQRVGVYGGYRTIAHCYAAGSARWFWQTYAWSVINGTITWHPANHLEQYHNGVTIGGADVDLTRARQDDFGQWGVDVTKQDVIDALNEWAAASTQTDGTPDSVLGRRTLNQGIPNGMRPLDSSNAPHHQRTAAWQVLEDVSTGVATLLGRPPVDVKALAAALVAALPPVTGGITPEQVEAACEAAVRTVMNNAQY